SLLHSDPPRHTRLRGLVATAFRPQRVALLQPRVAAIARQLLERVEARGEMDVVADLAAPLPVIVIAELLGIPPERHGDFKRWSDAVVVTPGQGMAALAGYFAEVVQERRRRPGDDLISTLLAAELDGERLGERELLDLCALLLVGGDPTTTNPLANRVLCLDPPPGALARRGQEPGLLPSAVEEVLRYLSPVQHTHPRLARVPTTLGGHRIAAGEGVLPCFGFGHGAHFCLGAPLARLEARVALGLMVRRLAGEWHVPDVPIDVPPHPAVLFGPRRLPLTWEHGRDS